jgi:serine/threonine-protein kinase
LAAPARRLGRYVIQEELGRGAMGVVYRALDPVLGRTVALKVLQGAFGTGEDPQFEERFAAEARAAARLSHPGIVTVHDAGRDESTGTFYIAFEHLEGQTLDAAARGRALPPDEALRIGACVAEALHHAHEQGIVHRDVKPANVMLLRSGEPKLMDFGIAKLPASQLTAAGEFFGTPAYMSPEQLAGETLDRRSDVFSLGAVLYRLLTGHDAFAAPTIPGVLARVATQHPPAPSSVAGGLSPQVDAVVARALAKDRTERHPDAAALAADLKALRSGAALPSAAPAAAPTRVVRRARPSRRWVLAGSAVAAAAVLVALGIGPPGLARPPRLLAPPPAQLEIAFEHPLRTGTLRIWVDDDMLLEEPLESRVVEDLKVFRVRKGRAEALLDVPPGERVVRVAVDGDGFSSSKRIRGTFESGARQRLEARVSGLLGKELSLWWGS